MHNGSEWLHLLVFNHEIEKYIEIDVLGVPGHDFYTPGKLELSSIRISQVELGC